MRRKRRSKRPNAAVGCKGPSPSCLNNFAAVNLIYYQGLKYREAADQLKVPVGTVKSRLHTAVLKLNEAFQEAHLS